MKKNIQILILILVTQVVFSQTQTQNITLVNGWSFMSTYLVPVNPSVQAVFFPIIASLDIIKDDHGSICWPAVSYNDIGNMTIGKGYFVKMHAAATLTVTGTAVVPQLTPITIPAGWSMFGYLRQTPISILSLNSQLNMTNVAIIRDTAGHVFWPQFSLCTIGEYSGSTQLNTNIDPGQGYSIKAIQTFTLTYPAN
ncbi:MAG: hypothetical protein NTW49_12785 [Bacteroidia bacterium]|nr:hypothetical protein [Bacteroidia bacterium]